MIIGKKGSFLMFILVVCLVAMLPVENMALMKGNDSDLAFMIIETQTLVPETGEQQLSLREYLINGAGYFLDSYSDTLSFLKYIEVSELTGTDLGEMQVRINSAVLNMEQADDSYINLRDIAAVSSYNQSVVGALRTFPYTQYRMDNNLNKPVFKKVQNYLQSGDVKGAYCRMQQDTRGILKLLNTIKSAVDAGQIPEAPSFWKL
ncbi:MAG: hypothetical protein GY940_22795, partial [bacterium]|nr:hypothetical protein [bacterium]